MKEPCDQLPDEGCLSVVGVKKVQGGLFVLQLLLNLILELFDLIPEGLQFCLAFLDLVFG